MKQINSSVLCINTIFSPLITRPTRFTSTSATLTDNITTNVFNDALVSSIFVSGVSDHLLVFYVSNDITVTTNFTSVVNSYRHICGKNITFFREKLVNTQWQNVIESQDIDENYEEAFLKKFDVL